MKFHSIIFQRKCLLRVSLTMISQIYIYNENLCGKAMDLLQVINKTLFPSYSKTNLTENKAWCHSWAVSTFSNCESFYHSFYWKVYAMCHTNSFNLKMHRPLGSKFSKTNVVGVCIRITIQIQSTRIVHKITFKYFLSN